MVYYRLSYDVATWDFDHDSTWWTVTAQQRTSGNCCLTVFPIQGRLDKLMKLQHGENGALFHVLDKYAVIQDMHNSYKGAIDSFIFNICYSEEPLLLLH